MRYEEMLNYVEDFLTKNNAIRTGRHSFRNRYLHSKRVFGWAKKIANDLDCNKEVLFTAAIFHDVGYAYGKGEHALKSEQIFRDYANNHNLDAEFVEAVCYCIRNHSNKGLLKEKDVKPELILLLEADLLDEEGALAITWDILSAGGEQPDSFESVFNYIYKYSIKILSQDYMVTPLAIKYWNEKKRIVKEFVSALEEDLFVGEELL